MVSTIEEKKYREFKKKMPLRVWWERKWKTLKREKIYAKYNWIFFFNAIIIDAGFINDFVGVPIVEVLKVRDEQLGSDHLNRYDPTQICLFGCDPTLGLERIKPNLIINIEDIPTREEY